MYLKSILFILIISIVLFSCKTKEFATIPAKTKIALREAGNQLLLKNQDSTSLILPVLALDVSVYKLEFKKHLSFEPNQLVAVINPNQIIKRRKLTKGVWEDNNVFAGRSLDTYIFKLRKKLQDDDSIKLTNGHGVCYKLEII